MDWNVWKKHGENHEKPYPSAFGSPKRFPSKRPTAPGRLNRQNGTCILIAWLCFVAVSQVACGAAAGVGNVRAEGQRAQSSGNARGWCDVSLHWCDVSPPKINNMSPSCPLKMCQWLVQMYIFPIEISSLFVGDMLVLGSVLDRQYTKASGDSCKSIPIASSNHPCLLIEKFPPHNGLLAFQAKLLKAKFQSYKRLTYPRKRTNIRISPENPWKKVQMIHFLLKKWSPFLRWHVLC